MGDRSSVAVEHHIAEYLAHLAVERNLSPRTVEAYARDLRQLALWLTEHGITLGEVDRATVRNYIGSRRDGQGAAGGPAIEARAARGAPQGPRRR